MRRSGNLLASFSLMKISGKYRESFNKQHYKLGKFLGNSWESFHSGKFPETFRKVSGNFPLGKVSGNFPSLHMTYRSLFGCVAIEADNLFNLAARSHNTRGQELKIEKRALLC